MNCMGIIVKHITCGCFTLFCNMFESIICLKEYDLEFLRPWPSIQYLSDHIFVSLVLPYLLCIHSYNRYRFSVEVFLKFTRGQLYRSEQGPVVLRRLGVLGEVSLKFTRGQLYRSEQGPLLLRRLGVLGEVSLKLTRGWFSRFTAKHRLCSRLSI